MTHDEAFHKGVDYAVEFLIFYGILGGLSIYELRKNIKASHDQKH